MQYSKYQLAIFDAVKNTNKNICVEATAGAGKTTTLLAILNLIPRTKSGIFLSFSNTIVNELKSKVPPHVKASTLHSFGCRMVMGYYKRCQIDDQKFFKKLLNELPQGEKTKDVIKFCGQTSEIINFARMTLCSIDEKSITDMCNRYNLDYESRHIKKAINVLMEPVKRVSKIDFTDMIYLPALDKRLITERFDFVMLDEAQDLNNAQKAFLEKIIKPGGRLIAVGDSQQSIYSFSGSSIDSFEKLKQRPNTITLSLSISYRCSKKIVEEARKVYDVIEAYESNEDGIVRVGHIDEVKEGDMVVCRKTAPLITVFFNLLEDNIKATIVGKDIEAGLLRLAEKVQCNDLERAMMRLKDELSVVQEELKRLGFKNISTHPKYVSLLDKKDVIELILKNIADPGDLVKTIKELFREDREAVKLMTIHRSKGLESDRVFIIEKYNNAKLMPSPYATQQWELTQESNLNFVAITRAKKELVYVHLNDN